MINIHVRTINEPKGLSLADGFINNMEQIKCEGGSIKLPHYQACIIKIK